MTRRTRALTVFGEDLDSLLKKAGKFTLPEYADECGVSYKYILQLRTIPERRPGKLYVDLLKPFARLHIINLTDSQQLSLRHRGKPLSFTECRELFPDLPENELVESVKQADELKDLTDFQLQSTKTDDSIAATGISPSKKPRQLYPHVFVGRENELNELKLSFDNAVADHGSLVMVVGEPGIGKTTLCGQLTDYVHEHGGISLTGHCSEPGSLSLPYLAFIEALGSYVLICDEEDLRDELGFGTSDIARIVPEIVDRLKVTIPPVKNVDEERYRLLQSVTNFLGNIAVKQPLLLIFEDLHNADHGTLEMLKHIARNLGSKRLLIVGTYRDIEVDRTHPLSATLAELRRLPNFERVFLRGLDITEIKHMLSSILGHDIPTGLDKAVYTQTEGNPLFVEEVAYYLVEERLSTEESESKQSVRDIYTEMKIPEGLRDVLGKRLSALSQNCNYILSMASVIGREFRLDVLQKIAGLSEVEVLEAIEEAQSSAIIVEGRIAGTAVTYRFSHALFHQTLYEEIIAPRRIRLHQQVARALEEIYASRLDEHAAELAEHFSHSSDTADLEKAVSYSEMAAKRAIAVFAFGEAVRLLEQALQVQRVLDPDDREKKCDLLLALGDALTVAGEPERAMDVVLLEAFALAEAIGDKIRASKACSLATTGLFYYAGPNLELWNTPAVRQWVDKTDRYAEPDTPERAWADEVLGGRKWIEGLSAMDYSLMEEGLQLWRQSLELARRLGDPATYWTISYLRLQAAGSLPWSSTLDTEERWRLAEEMADRPRDGVAIKTLGVALAFIGNTFMESGQRERAEGFYKEVKELAERSGQGNLILVSIITDAITAMLDGRLEDIEEINRYITARGEELGLTQYAWACVYWTGPRCQILLGKADVTPEYYPNTLGPTRALYLAYTGQDAEATEIINQLVLKRPNLSTTQDIIGNPLDIIYLEAALLVGHKEVVERLLQSFTGINLGFITPPLWTCPQRILGAASAFLGKHEEAREYYSESLKMATEIRCRPELALTRLQLAELLLDHYPDEKAEAIEHLDFAIKEFREMKMQPSLERALRRKEILKA